MMQKIEQDLELIVARFKEQVKRAVQSPYNQPEDIRMYRDNLYGIMADSDMLGEYTHLVMKLYDDVVK